MQLVIQGFLKALILLTPALAIYMIWDAVSKKDEKNQRIIVIACIIDALSGFFFFVLPHNLDTGGLFKVFITLLVISVFILWKVWGNAIIDRFSTLFNMRFFLLLLLAVIVASSIGYWLSIYSVNVAVARRPPTPTSTPTLTSTPTTDIIAIVEEATAKVDTVEAIETAAAEDKATAEAAKTAAADAKATAEAAKNVAADAKATAEAAENAAKASTLEVAETAAADAKATAEAAETAAVEASEEAAKTIAEAATTVADRATVWAKSTAIAKTATAKAETTATAIATIKMPTPTPTPVYGIVTKNSTIRREPKETSSHVDFVFIGEKVVLENAQGNWVHITIDDDTRSGWVREKNIDTSNPLRTIEPTPTIHLLNVNESNIEERSVVDKIDAGDRIPGHVYKFTPQSPDLEPTVNINFTLLFYSRDSDNIGTDIQIAVYDKDRYNQTKHRDIIDSDAVTTKLSVGGNLQRLVFPLSLAHGSVYYLRIANKSSQTVFYCFAAADVEKWDKCP